MTFDEFKIDATFVHFAGKRHVFVLAYNQLFPVKQQRYGKLTVEPDTVLREIYSLHFEKPLDFMGKLDRDLRAIGAK